MTEESEFERRVRGDLDAIAGAVPDVPAGTPLDQLSRPPARRVPLLAAVAAGALLLAGVVWVADDGDSGPGPADVADASTTTGPPASTTVPTPEAAPPSETGPHRIWMSTDVVSRAGTDVTFAVVGPRIDGEVSGASTTLERWTGEEWEAPPNAFGYCGRDWTCALNEQSPADVALQWDRGVLGHETIRIAGLDDGWYRLAKTIEGEPATAVFRSTSAELGPPIAPSQPWTGANPELEVRPVVVDRAGSTLTLRHDYVDTNAALVDVRVEVWSAGEWSALLAVDATAGTELVLPALPPGEYRVTAGGGGLEARFWVADDISDSLACHTTIDLADLLDDAAAFDGPVPPTVEMRSSFTPGGFRVEWTGADRTIRYSYPVGSVIDLVGERTVTEGPVMLWYQGFGGEPSTVEAWVQLPPCGDRDDVTAGFTVTGGTEQENVTLALRLGRELARLENPDFAAASRTGCPGPDAPDPETPNAVHDVWLYCRTSADQASELGRVPTIFSPGDPIEAVIRRTLSETWNGLESALPIGLRGAPTEIEIVDGVLTIDWGWDFAADPIDDLTTSNVSGRIIDQIAANAFQFDEIDAIDLGDLPLDLGGDSVYTREQWEQAQAEE